MKKFAFCSLALCLALSLTACDALTALKDQLPLPGKTTEATGTAPQETATETTPAGTKVPESQTVETTPAEETEPAPAAPPIPVPSQLTYNSDGSYTLLMPVTEYMSQQREEEDAVHIEYNEFGNVTEFWGDYLSDDRIPCPIEYDDAGRPLTVKNAIYKDEYRYSYDDAGNLISIGGKMNSGQRDFLFTRTNENGAAWELTQYWPNSTQVLRYDENFRQIERGSYDPAIGPSGYVAAQTFSYDDYSRITQWDWIKVEDGTFTYTPDHFDAMGHCLTHNSIVRVKVSDDSDETLQRKDTDLWLSQTETDAQGRVIRDTHTLAEDPESAVITYTYNYEGDTLTGMTYTCNFDYLALGFMEHVYAPITLHCDELQLAFLMIYGQDMNADQANSTRNITVDMRN